MVLPSAPLTLCNGATGSTYLLINPCYIYKARVSTATFNTWNLSDLPKQALKAILRVAFPALFKNTRHTLVMRHAAKINTSMILSSLNPFTQ